MSKACTRRRNLKKLQHSLMFCLFFPDGRDQYIPNIELTHSLNLVNACGEPDYTLFTIAYAGILDHIFIDANNLRTKQIIPLPDHEDVVRYTALPNHVIPSDHLALICDVEWIDEDDT